MMSAPFKPRLATSPETGSSLSLSSDEGESWHHFRNLESLDDRTRIIPEAVEKVMAHKKGMDHRDYELPDEAEQEDNVYTNCSYCSATLIEEGRRLVLTYDVSPAPYFALKLRVLPVEWFYT